MRSGCLVSWLVLSEDGPIEALYLYPLLLSTHFPCVVWETVPLMMDREEAAGGTARPSKYILNDFLLPVPSHLLTLVDPPRIIFSVEDQVSKSENSRGRGGGPLIFKPYQHAAAEMLYGLGSFVCHINSSITFEFSLILKSQDTK